MKVSQIFGERVRLPRSRTTSATATAIALLAAAVTLPAGASATPVRTASTTSYTDATYLQDALGLPSTDTSPAIEPVTYDRFQWLLQQPGEFAVLIGDPAEDSTFAARAQAVEAAAKADGVKQVYWFDPNLSGNAVVGSGSSAITEPNLDIRNPAGITSLSAASQTVYRNAWLNLVGNDLGDGVTATTTGAGSENSVVTATIGTSTVNDYGLNGGYSTKVSNTSGGALYDYSSGSAPANVLDSYFFIYNEAGTVTPSGSSTSQPEKILSWVDLTTEPSPTQTQADVTAAVKTVGVAKLTELDQFAWWESEVNSRETTQAPSNAQGGNVPILSSADDSAADGGWRIDQVTYPELVDLLKHSTTASAVILFGGTWCPNTRPELGYINKYAQQNNVTVFNYDTVLDGGNVGGRTTSPSNPLQTRNTAAYSTTANANPSSLYGDLVSTYLNNLETQYSPTGTSVVKYYPGGNYSTGTLTTINKLQVPYLIGYQAANNGGGVNRQWIIDNGDGTYTEYMSYWWVLNPQANELGISTIPSDAPIWTSINSELAKITYQTNPADIDPNSAIDTDDAQYLDSADTATVTYTAAVGSTPASVTVVSGGSSAISISPSALSAALTALGSSAPTNLAAAKTALIAAETASPQSATQISNLTTVVGAWGVAQQRKTVLTNAWGNSTTPGSVIGGAAAVNALNVFFGGLPGGVVSTQTVTAPAVTYGAAPQIGISVANDFGRNPTGDVSLTVKLGTKTVVSTQTPIANGAASFKLSSLAAGTYSYTLTYAGDDQIAAFTKSGSLKVAKVKVKKLAGAASRAQTAKRAGTYKVTIATASGLAKASGKVTIKLRKGKITKQLVAKLTNGSVTYNLPKLARGTWTVTIVWPGDSNYLAGSANGGPIKVTK